jgi:hypothetical protein
MIARFQVLEENQMKQAKNQTAAEALHAYMTFRAAKEGVGHKLSVSFYRRQLDRGVTDLFGVLVLDGKLLGDGQQPALFDEWLRAPSA